MTIPLPLTNGTTPCWQQIGVWGDRSCPELIKFTHCHNCPVFAAAGRRFLDAPSPPGYLDEWADRLGEPEEDESGEQHSVLVFRLGDEWLALLVGVLVEVTPFQTPHRIPHRGGLLAGTVNIRGELHLSVRLDLMLNVARADDGTDRDKLRLIVIRKDSESWVFAADAVDQVHRLPVREVVPAAPTLARAAARLNKGVFSSRGRAVGLLDETKLFQAIRERTR